MKLLIDSHALVWSATERSSLSVRAREAIADRSNLVLVSAVAAYELELKRLRDPLLAGLPDNLDDAVRGQNFEWLDVTPEHASEAAKLPRLHGDPFDRIIIAQAFVEGAAIVSADRWFPGYGAPLLW
jgi:PIN domain nuclease of toxin-antitoxin system